MNGLAVAAIVAGCAPDSSPALDATVELSEVVGTVAFVSWTPPDAGASWVEYGLDREDLDRATPRATTGTGLHEQVVLGLTADSTWYWRAVTEIGGEKLTSAVGTVTTASPPPGVAGTELTIRDRTRHDPARWLLTVTVGGENPATVVIYDREGNPVWFYESPGSVRKMHTARPGRDGASIVFGYYDQEQEDELGGIYRVSMDGRDVAFTPTVGADHDFVERADGSFGYLHLDKLDAVNVEGEIVPVAANAIYETPPEVALADRPPTVIFDHFDDSGQVPYWTCKHMEELKPELAYHQWTHANSLIPDPEDPERYYWMNYRFEDTLVRVDRTSGTVDWAIGGVYDDSDLTAEDAFDHGHLSHFWPGGFLMFDNNTHMEGVSRVREYAYERATKHVEMVREWPGALQTPGMADARRTEAGGVVVNWAGEGKLQERTIEGDVVWELEVQDWPAGRITLLHDLYALDPTYAYDAGDRAQPE